MPPFLESVFEFARDYAFELIAAGVFTAAGWYLGQRRARSKWRKREFLDRLNFSLNIVDDEQLLIRTLMEKSCEEVFLNSVAVTTVLDAARRTTAEDSLLPLPEQDYWYYLNAVLNEVAEKFAIGSLKQDMGQPVDKATYVICLTCESAGPMKTRKVRAMVVRKERLLNLPESKPRFEQEHHITRWQTLNQLAAAYRNTPHRFLDVEICT